jgi:hypothetical protein
MDTGGSFPEWSERETSSRFRIFNFNLRFQAVVLKNSSTVAHSRSTVERLCNHSGCYVAWEGIVLTAYVSGSQTKLPRKTDVTRARERDDPTLKSSNDHLQFHRNNEVND